jgi:hypothetical protein
MNQAANLQPARNYWVASQLDFFTEARNREPPSGFFRDNVSQSIK